MVTTPMTGTIEAGTDIRDVLAERRPGYSEHLAGYTATPAVNAIPYLVDAEPGIRTIFDLPPLVPVFGPE